jgi:hypothetical protein
MAMYRATDEIRSKWHSDPPPLSPGPQTRDSGRYIPHAASPIPTGEAQGHRLCIAESGVTSRPLYIIDLDDTGNRANRPCWPRGEYLIHDSI